MDKKLVSIIIPAYNEEKALGTLLESIKKQTYKNIEVVVVDDSSSDSTPAIAKRYTDKVFIEPHAERSKQRNFGAGKSKGEYLIFLDADMELPPKVIEECVQKVESYKVSRVNKVIWGVVIPEKSVGEGFWAKCKALERSFYLGIDWIEAPRFFSKQLFNKFKGYDESQTGTEDYDLPQRIKKDFGEDSILRINSFIIHYEGNLSLLNTLRKKFYYAKTAGVYATRKSNSIYFKKQSNILERYKLFFSNPTMLFKNPVVGFGMLFMKTLEFGVGGIGYLSSFIKQKSYCF